MYIYRSSRLNISKVLVEFLFQPCGCTGQHPAGCSVFSENTISVFLLACHTYASLATAFRKGRCPVSIALFIVSGSLHPATLSETQVRITRRFPRIQARIPLIHSVVCWRSANPSPECLRKRFVITSRYLLLRSDTRTGQAAPDKQIELINISLEDDGRCASASAVRDQSYGREEELAELQPGDQGKVNHW